MGGATSKLEENDWDKADGHLSRFSTTVTIVGAPPTTEYGIYYVTKRGLNQREFDVTDSQRNLLYTTRAVPKTIACFDVLGRELNQFLLRVNVDISRRYWIVCRYNVPSFTGQLPDNAATTKVALEFAARQEPCSTPMLYRKCCIVVSWSRYDAIAAMFGPPTVDMLLTSPSDDGGISGYQPSDESDDSLFMEGTKIASRMQARNESQDEDCDAETESLNRRLSEDKPSLRKPEKSQTENTEVARIPNTCAVASLPSSENIDDDEIPSSEPVARDSAAQASSVVDQDHAVGAENLVQQWLSTQSQSFLEQSRSILDQSRSLRQKSAHYLNQQVETLHGATQTKSEPLEGAVQLDGPLLLCQEIYNKIVGNHQTSLVTKSKVLELLKEDKQFWVDQSQERQQDMNESEIGFLQLSGLTERRSPGKAIDTEKNHEAESVAEAAGHCTDHCQDDERQPLVGYWAWENTLRSQKMKMHVAKDADLALHVVLAIISNQVRYERNAIAMTV